MRKLLFLLSILIISQQVNAGSDKRCNGSIPEYIENRFSVNNNGTVTDNLTGLMWMQCNLGARWDQETLECIDDGFETKALRTHWEDALQQTVTFNSSGGLAGHSDWRLPNIKEISSLIYRHCKEPMIDTDIFLDAKHAPYWSSTPTTDLRSFERDKLDNEGKPIPLLGKNNQEMFDKNNNPLYEQETFYANGAWVMSFKDGKVSEYLLDSEPSYSYVRLLRNAN